MSEKPLQKEIVDYKPKIDENTKIGNTLDTLTKEVAQPVQASPHYRSTELSEITKEKTPRKPEEPVQFLGKQLNTLWPEVRKWLFPLQKMQS